MSAGVPNANNLPGGEIAAGLAVRSTTHLEKTRTLSAVMISPIASISLCNQRRNYSTMARRRENTDPRPPALPEPRRGVNYLERQRSPRKLRSHSAPNEQCEGDQDRARAEVEFSDTAPFGSGVALTGQRIRHWLSAVAPHLLTRVADGSRGAALAEISAEGMPGKGNRCERS